MLGPVTRSRRHASPPPAVKNLDRQPPPAEIAYENKPVNYASHSKKRGAPPGVSPLRRICPRAEGQKKEALGHVLTTTAKVRDCGELSDIQGEEEAAFGGPDRIRHRFLSLSSCLELPEGPFPTNHPELANTLAALGETVNASPREVGAALRL